jgi:hypothetical protein
MDSRDKRDFGYVGRSNEVNKKDMNVYKFSLSAANLHLSAVSFLFT